jgi:hypothetical protein
LFPSFFEKKYSLPVFCALAPGTLGTGLPKTVCAHPVLQSIPSRKSRIKLYLRNAISLHRTASDYKKNGLCMTNVMMTFAALD